MYGRAGGIGGIAIQLAKHLGAYVATTVSADDIGYVRSLGADQVIDYNLKTPCGTTLLSSIRRRDVRAFKVMKQFGVEAFQEFTQVTTDRLAELTRLPNLGALEVHVERTFPLERAAAALVTLERIAERQSRCGSCLNAAHGKCK